MNISENGFGSVTKAIAPSYLCEVLEARWDPDRHHSWRPNRGRRDPSVGGSVRGAVRGAVLRCRDRARLIHDRSLALFVAHVEADRRGLAGVSVSARRTRVRGSGVAAGLRHRVGCVAVKAWVNWRVGGRNSD